MSRFSWPMGPGQRRLTLSICAILLAAGPLSYNACGKLGNLETGSQGDLTPVQQPPPTAVTVSKPKISVLIGSDALNVSDYIVSGTPPYVYSVITGNALLLSGSIFNPTSAGLNRITITDSKGQKSEIDIEVLEAKVDFDFTKNTLTAKVDGSDNNQLLNFSRNDGNMAIATYVNNLNQVKTVIAAAPRFMFDPVKNLALGLFIERGSQNLITSSSELAAPPWAYGSIDPLVMAVALNGSQGPDGLMSADNVDFQAVVGTFVNSAIINATINSVYTASLWAKSRAAVAQNLTLKFPGTNAPPKLIPLTDKWVRHSITGTALAATIQLTIDNDANGNELLNGAYWGVQVELGDKPSSYIPTVAAAVTRGSDFAKITQTQNFDATQGIFVLEFVVGELPPNGGNAYVFGYSNGEFGNAVPDGIYISGKNNLTTLDVIAGGTVRTLTGTTAWTLGGIRKVAFSYSASGVTVFENGMIIGTLPAAALPMVNLISLGYSAGHGNNTQSNNYIRSLKYYSIEGVNSDLRRLSL